MPPFRAVPYAPKGYDPRGSRISDLLVRRGDAQASGFERQAESALRGGDAWTRGIVGAGQAAMGGLGEIARYQEQAPQRELQGLQLDEARGAAGAREAAKHAEAELSRMFSSDSLPKPQDIIAVVGPERGLAIVKGIAALRDDNVKKFTDTSELIRDVMLGMQALPEKVRAEVYPGVRGNLVQRGIITEEDAPEAYDPAWWDTATKYGQQPKTPGTRSVTTRNPDGTETTQIVEDTPGQEFVSTPKPEPEKTHTVTVRGPNGRPVKKVFTESELKGGVEEYREPTSAGGESQAGWATHTVTDPTTNQTQMVRVNSRTGEVQPVQLPGGAQPGGQRAPRLTAGQQDDLATMDTVVDLAKLATTLGDKISWKGVGGMGKGWASSLAARNFGTGTKDQEKLRNYIGNIQGTIAKLRGGTAFSAAEKAMLDSYTPGINDSDMVIKSKIESLTEYVAAKRRNTLKQAGATSDTAASSDPLGILD
jgi:hypothetical protein